MSWVPTIYWALRCDGREGHTRCEALLYGQPGNTPFALNDVALPVRQPLLFTEQLPALAVLRSEPEPGWLVTRDRALCPDHVAAEEYLAAASVDGLPLDEST